jgi:hypothetical protein
MSASVHDASLTIVAELHASVRKTGLPRPKCKKTRVLSRACCELKAIKVYLLEGSPVMKGNNYECILFDDG